LERINFSERKFGEGKREKGTFGFCGMGGRNLYTNRRGGTKLSFKVPEGGCHRGSKVLGEGKNWEDGRATAASQ